MVDQRARGPRFTRAQLESFRDSQLPDLAGAGLRLLFVGINPGLWTAATQIHFGRPGNRFYPALRLAGIIDPAVSPGPGPADPAHLVERGIGITNLVPRATARADELSTEELRDGVARLVQFVTVHQPLVVAFAGITAYRIAFQDPTARAGRQAESLAGAMVWVVPNPSGLNAHETAASLAAAYAEPARAAGLID